MRITQELNFRKNNLLIVATLFSYILSIWLFKDFKLINKFYYLRLLIPTIIIFLCIVISCKIIYLYAFYETRNYYNIVILLVIALLTINLIYSIKFPSIQFDAWNMYDFSKHVFTDFGRMDMIRQHIYNTPYGIGFPPLFPFLMALLNFTFDFGVLSSLIINIIISFLVLFYIQKIGILLKTSVVSIIISALLLFNPLMLGCFLGGSTIPFGILIFIISAYIIIQNTNQFNKKYAVILSFISGLGVLNRFDYLPIAIAFGFLIMFLDKRANLAFSLAYYITLLVMLSPWIFYSVIHFNTLFITDNARRLINIVDTRPTTFFSLTEPALTLFDDPLRWLNEIIKRILGSLIALYFCFVRYTLIKEILIATFLWWFANGCKKIEMHLRIKNKEYIILSIPLILQTLAIILTGYSDQRYHILISLYFFFLVLLFLSKYAKNNNKEYSIFFVILIAICIIIPKTDTVFLEKTAYRFVKVILSDQETKNWLFLTENTDVYKYLKDVDNPRIIINRSESTMNIPKFMALSDMVTTLSPSNISISNIKDFVIFFNLNYLYSSDENQLDIFKNSISVIPTGIKHLYKLQVQ